MNGLHLVADCYNCQCPADILERTTQLEAQCVQACRDAGMQVVGQQFYQFEPSGVTGAVLLAESHLAIHTWPETGNVTLDIYVCNYQEDNSHKAQRLYDLMIALLKPERTLAKSIERGAIDA